MFNVLIVDDEKWICELICSSVQWNELGMQVCATAGNGLEALQALEDEKIDVVITDIRMPGLDGIGLIKTARERGYAGHFVIVSGFQDFEYAKSAIQFNVKSYLVKPVDEDELTVILYKITDELKESERNRKDHDAVRTRLESVSKHMKEQFARLLVQGAAQKHILKDIDIVDELGFVHPQCLCVVFRIDGNPGIVPENDIVVMLSDRIMEYVNKALVDMGFVYACYMEEQSAVYILNFGADEQVADHLKNHMGDLKQLVGAYRQYALTVGVGSVVNGIGRISDSFRDADTAVKYRLIAGRNQFIDSMSLSFDKNKLRLTETHKRRLASLIETQDKEGLNDFIGQVFMPEDKNKVNPADLFDIARELWTFFRETLAEARFKVNASELEVYRKMESSSSITMLSSYLSGILAEELLRFEEHKSEEYSRPVAAIKEYISSHYASPISVGDAAARVHLNPNYLSKLFKTETGLTFLDYLTQYRMDAAKEMLKDISIKISGIPEAVGYKDMRHFVKIFRKISGLTPHEYRKLYL